MALGFFRPIFRPRMSSGSHLTLRMSSKRFARLGNGFGKRLPQHAAAVSLYVAFYNFVRIHETLRTTPAVAQGIANHG
jgi:hypothetical protein